MFNWLGPHGLIIFLSAVFTVSVSGWVDGGGDVRGGWGGGVLQSQVCSIRFAPHIHYQHVCP